MPETPLPTRRYDEQRTDAILRRAAELQASGGTRQAGDRGLTLPEMESLAQDAGIDPALIRQAAHELESRAADRSAAFLGAPVRSAIERVIPGEMTEDAWGSVVAEAQADFGAGYASKAGRTRTWSAIAAGREPTIRSVVISATHRKGATVVRADEAHNRLAGSLFGALVGGLGCGMGVGLSMAIGIGVLKSPPLAALLAATAVSSCYLLARAIFRSVVARRSRQLHAVVERATAAMTGPPTQP